MSAGALRSSYHFGARDERWSVGTWTVLVVMATALAASASLAMIMFGVPGVGGPLVEPPVAAGPWSFPWSGEVVAPEAQQHEQVRALRAVTGGAATLLALLCLLTIGGLWRQRLALRRSENEVHWSVGARRLQRTMRLLGEARRWLGLTLALSLLAAAAVGAVVDAAYPGAAPLTPNVAAAALIMMALAVLLGRWESGEGPPVRESAGRRLGELVASPAMIGAVGFAALSGVGILALHAPYASSASSEIEGSVVDVSLADMPMSLRGEALSRWASAATERGGVIGFASAGASRATGRVEYATAECGNCSGAGMPMPLKIVSAEVHAVSPDTFPLLEIAVTSGRDFDAAIDRGDPNVAIVSAALAWQNFQDGDPLGRRIRVGDSPWLTIVGVVSDRDDVQTHLDYAIYLPIAQARPTDVEIVSGGPLSSLEPLLAFAPTGARIGSLRSRADVFSTHRWFRDLLGAVGVATMILVGMGLWISADNEAGAARHEVAVRRAVGATRTGVWRFFAAFAGRRLAFTMIAGAWLSLFLGAGLESAYATIPRIDVLVWTGAAGWVAAMYLLGSARPILRAAAEPVLSSLNTG